MNILSLRGLARLGASVVALTGLIIAVSATGLALTPSDRHATELIGAVDAVIGLGTLFLPWQGASTRSLLLFPALTTGTVAALGVWSETTGASYQALLSLTALYLGVTQPRGTTVYALPALTGAWWLAYPSHSAAVWVRLPLAVMVWVLIGELLASLTSSHSRQSARLTSRAETDPLTGLANRRGMDRVLAASVDRLTVVCLDLDLFKAYNDSRGHAAGDELLRDFGSVLTTSVRAGDLPVRTGGEEFVVVMRGEVADSRFDRRVRRAWAERNPGVTFSAGQATQLVGEPIATTLERADRALYAAKALGRNTLVLSPANDGVVGNPSAAAAPAPVPVPEPQVTVAPDAATIPTQRVPVKDSAAMA